MTRTAETVNDLSDEEYRRLRGLHLSRLMFNPIVGWPRETRSFEEFVADYFRLLGEGDGCG